MQLPDTLLRGVVQNGKESHGKCWGFKWPGGISISMLSLFFFYFFLIILLLPMLKLGGILSIIQCLGQAGMFNDSSTHAERAEVLQALMSPDAGNLGSDVASPADINLMLARTEAELATFEQVCRSLMDNL